MKRRWVIIFTASLLAGCRSSQPATNPFFRTTVPPPATAQGMMVMPGEPNPAAAAPPVVTAPPAVSPPVPVTPAPAQPAPLISPPPPLGPPQGDKFNPPGGSYLYHQS
jgi:hypothetical protein